MYIKKSYSATLVRFAGLAAILIAVLLFGSCNRSRNTIQQQPTDIYRKFLSCVRQIDTLSTPELAYQLKIWMSLADSVSSALGADTIKTHSTADIECRLIHDSLRIEFSRLALSLPRTFVDLFIVKESISSFATDSALSVTASQIRPFFDSLDYVPAITGENAAVLSRYRSVLAATLADSIRSLSALRSFIRDEDVAYRSLISRLHSLQNTDVSDITHDTERCCLLVANAIDSGSIPYGEASVYMAMRTGRRLLQNVRVCLDDIKQDRIQHKDQAWAYTCMLLQPYISMDELSLALLSPAYKNELLHMAEDTPEALRRLQEVMQSAGGRLSELPGMLLEIYIASL